MTSIYDELMNSFFNNEICEIILIKQYYKLFMFIHLKKTAQEK